MKIKSQKDFYSGIVFMLVGAAFAAGASHYDMGSAERMGPGYFPFWLGLILAALGAIVLLYALVEHPKHEGDKIGKWAWKPLAYIVGANLLFGVLLGGLPRIGWPSLGYINLHIPSMGLIVAIFGLVLVASRASHERKLKEVLILCTVLAVGSYLTFVVLLKLQFPVWPAFLLS